MQTVNWKAVWMNLYLLELKRLHWLHTKASLVAAGLSEPDAYERVLEVLETGHYMMSKLKR